MRESPTGNWLLADLVRGFMGDTPLAAETGDAVDYLSRRYVQAVCRKEFSFWVQVDAILQCLQGCRVTQAALPIATSDGLELTFTANGRRMYSAGPSELADDAVTGAVILKVGDSRAFFVGQRLRNLTRNDDNSGTGYPVTAVDEKAGTVTVSTGIRNDWNRDDVITWWMPAVPRTAEVIENRDTTVRINGVRSRMRPGSITFTTPVSFTEEVGDRFPGEGIDATRTSSVDYNVLMRKDAALRLRDGFEGREVRFDVEFGKEDGRRMTVVTPRLKLATASVSFETPTVALRTQGRILGSDGEDSVIIILE